MKLSELMNVSVYGALSLAVLALTPACGPSGEEEGATTPEGTAEPTDPPEATDPPEGTEPPTAPPSSGAYPAGEYVGIAPWLFSFGTSAPYALSAQVATADDGNGGLTGIYIWLFWYDKADAQSGADQDCYFVDAFAGPSHEEGSNGDLDYASCQYCSVFFDVEQEYASNEGCNEELYNFWYTDGEGNELLSFQQYMGYRDAEGDGWPAEFADLSDSLDEAGFTGTLYDQVAADENAFFPMFAMVPDTEEKVRVDASQLTQIEVSSPAEARALLRVTPR